MSDYIKTEKVLDLLAGVVAEIIKMPPETHEERTETHECVCEHTETHGDLISRKAAIDEIMELPNCENGYSDTYDKARIVGVLEGLPSAEPERKTGQWIVDNEGMFHCSECAKIPVNRIRDTFKVVYDIHPLKMNYCPNCGVRMVGEQK